jgi:hypothetical protein
VYVKETGRGHSYRFMLQDLFLQICSC